MYPIIPIFGKMIPAYGLACAVGVVLSLLVILIRGKRKGVPLENAIYIFAIGMVGAIVGAKLLYLVTIFPQLVEAIQAIGWQLEKLLQLIAVYLSGGFIFYGGLIGGILAACWAAKSYGVALKDYFIVLLPCVALVAGFGRVGCFMAGCCYGVPTELPIGVVFPEGGIAPSGMPLVPVQLIEAAFDFLLFFFMLWLTNRENSKSYAVRLYVVLYACMRFILEFFRGDSVRGSFLSFSTSQWISVLLISVIALTFIVKKYPVRKK